MGKIKRKLKLRAAGSTGAPATPKKAGVNAGGQSKTPRSGKRGASEHAAAGTPSKKGKKASKPPANEDDDEEFATFNVKKEEVTDINHGADDFFQEATAYANTGGDQV